MPGTWADGIIIQAVADQLHLKLIIAETVSGILYCTTSVVNTAINSYLSTLPCSFLSGSSSNEVNSAQIVYTGRLNITENISNRNDENINSNNIQRTIQILKECFNDVKHASDSFQLSIHCESKKGKRKKYVREYRKQI